MAVKTLSATQARSEFLKIIKESNKSYDRFVITVQGIPRAVLLSYEDFIELEEELEILAQNPQFFEDRKKAREAHEKGETISLDELENEIGL